MNIECEERAATLLDPRRFALLATLAGHEIDALCHASRVIEVAPGEAFIREGEPNQWLFFLAHGEAEVLKRIDGDQCRIGVVSAPAVVGETSILDHQPANATLRAGPGGVRLVRTPASIVLQLMYANPDWSDALIRQSTRHLMLRALRANPLLRRLGEEIERDYLARARMVTLLRGERLSDRAPSWQESGWLLARGRISVEQGGLGHAGHAGALVVPDGDEATDLRALSDARIVRLPQELLSEWARRLRLDRWPVWIQPGDGEEEYA